MMTELGGNEFIIRLDGDVRKMFEEGTSVNVEIHNPHPKEGYDLTALAYLKAMLKKLNKLAANDKALADANVALVEMGKQLDDVRMERDEVIKKNLQIKKEVLAALK